MSAQEEFNQLVNNSRDKYSAHPEDHDDDPQFSDDDSSLPRNLRQRRVADSSDEDEEDTMVSRTANYHVPKNTFEANTGPKGVIADAQAFERARKKSFRRTLLSAAGFDANGPAFSPKSTREGSPPPASSSSSGEDEEERFMRRWRTSRMQELQGRSARRASPRGRVYGRVDDVDAVGYLDAVEKVTPGTVVVVCIYNPQSDDSAIVEECLVTIARRQPGTRFIKLHSDIAEMDHINAPALLAYRNGDVFATIVDVIRNIPRGRSCSADSLEDLLKMYAYPPPFPRSTMLYVLTLIPGTACYDLSFDVIVCLSWHSHSNWRPGVVSPR
ncbi:hypothetical protein N7492_010624 [Penicillium capsulatum]|uniref:Phosducin domain-containing protein n=1 Tax=Penicillium capsulatum TaxID=69766 RepID=A0A9W9HP09_9EURO|nr:hypothetical protein N7492_010624 [Penicillium capsulatum]KAJ6113123.1 hypothetical protein N7512_008447 [Penicillium capsulatum]